MATTSKHPHPGRTLGVFLAVVAALYGLMAVAQTWTPRLGLDLSGGTTITLTARNSTGTGQVSAESLDLARQILQQRVDGLGVGESAVTTQGGENIVVSVPNVQRDELIGQVGQTAELAFRNVYAVEAATPAPSASASPTTSASGSGASATPSATPSVATQLPGVPAAPASARPTAPASPAPAFDKLLAWQPTPYDEQDFAAYQCGDQFPDVSDQPLISCNQDQSRKYLLGPTLITGQRLESASSGVPQNELQPIVTLNFDNQGADEFLKATTALSAKQQPQNAFAIVLDGVVVSAAEVTKPIAGGSARIEGGFTLASAAELANVLKYGSLPLSFDLSSVENISATLGGDQLRAGIIAGLIGLALVIAYSFLYYRGLGLLVVGSLSVAAVAIYGAMVLLGESVGFALNLPGIAGAIVAIGITADSFVIYFERIRDEIRDGRTLRTAIETGWTKARSTIVVADAVSLLSASVLFILAVGAVKGFAFTLGLTTIIDLAIVFFFTKPMMSLLGRTAFFGQGHRLSGLDATHMGVSRDSLLGRRPRRTKNRKA